MSLAKKLVSWQAITASGVLVAAAACASNESNVDSLGTDASVIPVPVDAAVDASEDAPAPDAAPCADCDWFPSDCGADALCPNGPYEPNTAGGPLDVRRGINVIRGRGPSDVWAAGALGSLAHFDGTTWTRSDLGTKNTLRGLWLPTSGEVAISSFQLTFTRSIDIDGGAPPSAGGWTPVVPGYTGEERRLGDWIVEFRSAWAAPDAEWCWIASVSTVSLDIPGVWRMRRSPDSVLWAQSAIGAACTVEGCRYVNGVHGASKDALWAVGESGSAVFVTDADGETPSAKGSNTQTKNSLNAVWAASSSDAWAVGAAGTIRHNTGDLTLWEVVANVPTTEDLHAMWGTSSSDIWAVGEHGVVLHYDGKSWSRVKVAGIGNRRPKLTTVWSSGPGHVWVGGDGVVLSLGGQP
ncbi:hypothetical protein AKJ09_00506 [Labilithrix luteola]|uniref:Type IV fimbrial biogenesis protein PilY1 n=1 Tax=Labilithrix luteola TaxID=1391654 RepID=A0A0K1PK00_9BACT|nr:hypothetical protein AKJ09_00506 [Labilithrix luteola]